MNLRKMACAFAVVVCSVSCGGGTPLGPTTDIPASTPSTGPAALYDGVISFVPGKATVTMMAVHKNGEAVATFSGTAGNGLVYRGADGTSVTMFIDAMGRPSKAISGNTVFVFDNYTSTTVDVGIVGPAGQQALVPNVPLNTAMTSLSVAERSSFYAPAGQVGDAGKGLKIISGNLQIIGCASKLAIGSIAWPALPWAITTCGSTLIGHLRDIGAINESALTRSADAVNQVSGTLGCVSAAIGGGIVDCLAKIFDDIADAAEEYDKATAEAARAVKERLLRRGTFQGTFQADGTITDYQGCIFRETWTGNFSNSVSVTLTGDGTGRAEFVYNLLRAAQGRVGGGSTNICFPYTARLGINFSLADNGSVIKGTMIATPSFTDYAATFEATLSPDRSQLVGTITQTYKGNPITSGTITGRITVAKSQAL